MSSVGRAVSGIPLAARSIYAGWVPPTLSDLAAEQKKHEFVQCILWVSQEARAKWYKEFVWISESYERLGHKIDALKLLTSGCRASKLLVLLPMMGP
jgi:hypothetical protein